MIYVEQIRTPQPASFPKAWAAPSGDLALKVTNTTTLAVVPVTLEIFGQDALRYDLDLTFPDGIAVGEYDYELTAGGVTVSSGLLICRPGQSVEQYEQSINFVEFQG